MRRIIIKRWISRREADGRHWGPAVLEGWWVDAPVGGWRKGTEGSDGTPTGTVEPGSEFRREWAKDDWAAEPVPHDGDDPDPLLGVVIELNEEGPYLEWIHGSSVATSAKIQVGGSDQDPWLKVTTDQGTLELRGDAVDGAVGGGLTRADLQRVTSSTPLPEFLWLGEGSRPAAVVKGGLTAWQQRHDHLVKERKDRIAREKEEREKERAAKAEQDAEEEAREHLERDDSVIDAERAGEARQTSARTDVFVNPYAFVPLPQGADSRGFNRSEPAGHAAHQPEHLSGSVTTVWTAVSPLLLRGEQAHNQRSQFPTRPNGDGGRTPILPGSSVKGALRSLHETLAGGCLRVTDLDFVPVYRDQAVTNDRQLARVDAVAPTGSDRSFGRPVSLTLCDRIVWAEVADLQAALGPPSPDRQLLRTGDTASVDTSKEYPVRNRKEVPRDALRPGNDWVMVFSDTKARWGLHPYHAALGRVTGTTVRPTASAWQTYLRTVSETDDQRRAKAAGRADADHFKTATRNGASAQRLGARRGFSTGDVVWVRSATVDGELTVSELSLAQLWRHEGSGPLRGRVPAGLYPCCDPRHLCPSCRLFGATDDQGDDAGKGEQNSYRGHVRVTDGRTLGSVAVDDVELPAMGSPRIGSGQLTLRTPLWTAAQQREELPTREWGSMTGEEPKELRQLRGRKYYWHGFEGPRVQGQPWKRSDRGPVGDGEGNMLSDAQVVRPGGSFEITLTFQNLSRIELGGLLAALAPQVLLGKHRPPGTGGDGTKILGRVGGGKGLGFGSVSVADPVLEVWNPDSRYGTSAAPQATVNGLIAEFEANTSARIRETWPHLAAVLGPGHVNPDRIAYPPAAGWTGPRDKLSTASFEFWKQTSGRFLGRGQDPVIEVRDPADPRQYLDIVEDQGQH